MPNAAGASLLCAWRSSLFLRFLLTDRLSHSPSQVPVKLSDKLQVWIPVELTVVVQSLWAKSGASESFNTPAGLSHELHVWSTFLRAIYETQADVKGQSQTSSSESLSPASRHYLLRIALLELTRALGTNNIHAATRGLPNQVEIIRIYLAVREHLGPVAVAPIEAHPALFLADTGLFGVFGGQGPVWLPPLKELYEIYPVAKPVIEKAAKIVQEQSQSPEIAAFYRPHGFAVVSWLNNIDVPPVEYQSSAPLSCPMILLTQLVNYLVVCTEWQKTPAEVAKLFERGATGHSQGLIAAAIMASSRTTEELIQHILEAVRFMVWFGARLQQATPFSPTDVRTEVKNEAKQLGYSLPTPMLAVLHLDLQRLTKYISMVNKAVGSTSPARHIHLGLKNSSRINIVVGHPESLFQLVTILHRAEMPPKSSLDQARVPFSKRKKEFACRFVNVSVPFHSPLVASALGAIVQDAARLNYALDSSKLQLPVFGTNGVNASDASAFPTDLRTCPADQFMRTLVNLSCIALVDWVHSLIPASKARGVTHLIDFGHGGLGGIGGLCARNLNGAGIQVICADSFADSASASKSSAPSSDPLLQDKSALFDTSTSSVVFATSWASEYAPRLIKVNGKPMLDTKFTRTLGKPPVMVAGMTPTTVNHNLVAAVLNAGFHGELAGGGLPTEKMFKEKIESLVRDAHPGAGVTLNLLFLNPTQWGMQFPLLTKLASEGMPIEGLTIGAGVPSLDKATEIVSTLRSAGVQHLAFKPGSIESILAVVAIAQANPSTTIMLQWTGGRGGGHHSCEDFHEPILQTYADIRCQSNIVLVAGSGFGDAKDSWPYLNGSWSVAYGQPPMPFDAILVASRVMVALEAGTSTQAKELIVSTSGIEGDGQWENSYEGNAGGVVNVQSELGEPIHKVATRGIMLWRQFDKEFFSLPKDKIAAKIEERKMWIIERLNADFQKVYFGKKFDGAVCDLKDMTYAEVLFRLAELQFIYEQGSGGLTGRWIHDDFLRLTFDFATRVEERFIYKVGSNVPASDVQDDKKEHSKPALESQLGPIDALRTNPHAYLTRVVSQLYTDASTQLLASEDIDFFISLCRQRGRKPVNFVPVIDKDLSYWFKKDSLWQSEDVEAVPDADVQRVVILQGPMAVRYSNKVNEPVADILNGIHNGWVEILAKNGTDLSTVAATVENMAFPPLAASVPVPALTLKTPGTVERVIDGKKVTLKSLVVSLPHEPAALPDADELRHWLASLASSSWWNSVLRAPFITHDRRRQSNILASLFTPRAGSRIELVFGASDSLLEVNIYEHYALPHFPHQQPIVILKYDSISSQLSLTIHHVRPDTAKMIPLELTFRYQPNLGHACLQESTDNRNERVKVFYSQLWFDELSKESRSVSPMDAVFTNTFHFTKANIELFAQSIGRSVDTLPASGSASSKVIAPVDMAVVAAWESMVKSLFLNAIDADILKLVHLSNSFKQLTPTPIVEGDVVTTTMKITEIANTPTGQRVAVEGTLASESKTPLIGVKTAFFFRSNTPLPISFKLYSEDRVVSLAKKETVAILRSKSWMTWDSGAELAVGDRLVFHLESSEQARSGSSLLDIVTKGTIVKQAMHAKQSTVADGECIGKIHFEQKGVSGCVVRGFLRRFGTNLEHPVFFPNSGYNMILPDKIRVPSENDTYALASKDLNPIHTNPYFATLTKLPTTITHGMWTSANARRVVEAFAAKAHACRVMDCHTEFVGMVKPGDVLVTRLKHTGMKNGRQLIEIRTECEQTGEVVLKGTADVAGSKTAYVFTGQGSAEVGMGMDLYASSPVSKAIWDAADIYFSKKYGFSIINIVRNNPKEIEIFFGGKPGEAMRRNYQQLTQQVQVRDEKTGQLVTKQQPLFPQITDTTSSFTFRHHDGLLFATQFSQPALVLVEVAAFNDLRDKGLIPADCIFAGHSLGEYAALASVASVLSTESLVDIVFLRGMTMQNAVVRDAAGRSPYAMVAVNTGRVHPTLFREAQLNQVIQAIVGARNELLQVVNYNVDNYQYVVAGERGNLNALGFILNALHKILSTNAQAFAASVSKASSAGQTLADTPEMKELLAKAIKQAMDSRDPATGIIPLDRGMATIPLPGIDVPFHSSFLKDGVPPFRQILQQRMNTQALNKDLLLGRYIPNVTAAPFSLDKSYLQTAQQCTQSAILADVLTNFEVESKNPQQLAFKLLVELLAYQFASPVRWIETQHLFFSSLNVERFIEIGPAPTLMAMAKRTLETGQYSPLVSREVLWYGRDKANIYFQGTDVEVEEPAAPVAAPVPAKVAAPAAPAPVVQQVAAPAPAAASIPDAPPSALEFVQVLVALRLKRPINTVAPTETIKALVAGKSALQNELLGDLESEFGTKMPEGASEASLETLAKQMGASYKQLGKVGTTMTHKLVSNKMPGGYGMTQVKAYLSKFGLGEGKSQSVLLHATTMEPASRLSSEADAHSFLDSVVSAYAARTGQTITAAAAPAAAPSFAAASPVAASSAPAPIPDEPLKAVDALRVMVSQKVKKSLDQVPATTTIKDLVGGKSALQNELVGDIQKEFGTEPGDGAAELDLAALAARVGASYTKPGPFTAAAINKLVSSKMPGGYGLSSVRSYLAGRFGLGDGRIDGVLVHSLALEPANRFASEGEAHTWLDQVTQDYASKHGITLGSAGAAAGGARSGSVVDSAALKAFEARYNALIKEHMRVYHDYLGEDPLASEKAKQMQEELRHQAEAQLLIWQAEHLGDEYFEGIKPVFDTKKERRYNSSWNWNRQDCLQLYYDYACGRATQWSNDIRERLYHIKNRATPSVVDMVEYYLKKCSDDGHGEIRAFIQILSDTLRFVMDDLPKYREHTTPTEPSVQISANGIIQYKELPRVGVKDMQAYVQEMHRGPQFGPIRELLEESKSAPASPTDSTSTSATSTPSPTALPGTADDHRKEIEAAITQLQTVLTYLTAQKAPATVVDTVQQQIDKLTQVAQATVQAPRATQSPAPAVNGTAATPKPPSLPYLFLRQASRQDPSHRCYNEDLTMRYLNALMKVAAEGLSLHGKTALVIGSGKGSIGVEIVKGLLRSGAKVYATTSRFTEGTSSFYHSLFDRNGSKNSELVVLPFNQGSVQDVHALVNYIYDTEKSDLDFIVPFAALPENGRDIGDIDGRSELAHRIMLTNVLRLIGAIKEKKKKLSIITRPGHVLLPMSPNHGIFGFDGLYAESKLGLEALLTKWHSEGWKSYLSLAGAIIGWTRGTGLMNQNNVVAAGIEKLGARTFSAQEMSFNLIGLLHPEMVEQAQNEPVFADLNGCLHLVPELNVVVADLRASLVEEASVKKAVVVDHSLDQEIQTGKRLDKLVSTPTVTQRANITVPFPVLPATHASLSPAYTRARGMVNLENVVVVVGFGEVGPYGSARTRWEIESYGEFSIEGCIELAWMMGLIKYRTDGGGWIDAKSGERVQDDAIKARYETMLLAHTGIRLIEPSLFKGYDPHNKMLLHQVALNSDMAPLEVSSEEAKAFKQRHGDAIDTYQSKENPDAWYVQLKKGAVLYIPKALKFDRFVAGQVPTTWDPATLGIPADIINQVDRVTLFSLVSTVEALVSAGITDPYEFYQYVHVSEVGNSFGGGFGGMESIRRTYRDRLLELPVQGDILQETFINTVGAWLNMLLLSSSGPIKTPVGACATAVESVDIGVDIIKSGKAKIVVVGGYDDLGEEGSYEFASMKATANSAEEIAKGRTPREMSRPATSTRGGFVESQGAGTQVLMNAALAVQMGVPIYAIVEHVNTATDKVARSVPAPGQGILTTARESVKANGFVSPLLDIEYRRRHLNTELALIENWKQFELAALEERPDERDEGMIRPAAAVEAQAPDVTSTRPNGTSQNAQSALHRTTSSDNTLFAGSHSHTTSTSHSIATSSATSTASPSSASSASSDASSFLSASPYYEDMREHIIRETERRKRVAYTTWGNDFYRNNPRIAPLRGALAVYGLTIDDIAVASFHGTGTKGNDINESEVVQKQLEHLGRSKGNVILSIFQKYLTGHPKGAAAAWMLNGLIQSMLSGVVPGNRNADNIDPKLRDCSNIVFLNRTLHTYGYKAGLLKSFGFGQVGGEVLVIHPNFVLAQLTEDELKSYAQRRAARQNAAYRHWQDAVTGKALFVQVKDHPPYTPDDESRVYLDPLARASFDAKANTWLFQSGKGRRSGRLDEAAATPASGANAPPTARTTAASAPRSSSSIATSPSSTPHIAFGNGKRTPAPPMGNERLKRNISASALNNMEVMMREMGEGLRTTIDRGIGVDAQSIDEIEVCLSNTDFVVRNFTNEEVAYCRASPDPSSSFAGRWAAKEAVIKAISSCDADNASARNLWQGAGAPLRDIEILPSGSGAPVVNLSGHAADVAALLSISTIKVAISHSGDYAIAQAIAR